MTLLFGTKPNSQASCSNCWWSKPNGSSPLDEDGDGIADLTEIALVGNTTDLGVGPGSKGVSFNSNRDNDVAAMDADTVAGVVPSTGWVSTDGGRRCGEPTDQSPTVSQLTGAPMELGTPTTLVLMVTTSS